MRVFRYRDEGQWGEDAVSFALGAIGGLAAGVLISRAIERERLGDGLRDRAGAAVRRFRPARRQRLSFEQVELDRLEEDVLRAFHGDEILSERPVDIGAISRGIVELSGSVAAEPEAERAVRVASGVEGVTTVVNRLDIDAAFAQEFRDEFLARRTDSSLVRTGAAGGMGTRRQSAETDPDQIDDSRRRLENAMAAADRDQIADEGFGPAQNRIDALREAQRGKDLDFDRDEFDNQDPHGQHARRTLDAQPQHLNPDARVGEGMKPGIEREIERSE